MGVPLTNVVKLDQVGVDHSWQLLLPLEKYLGLHVNIQFAAFVPFVVNVEYSTISHCTHACPAVLPLMVRQSDCRYCPAVQSVVGALHGVHV